MPLSPELLAVVACPKCKGTLEVKPDHSAFLCWTCKLLYRVEDEIPNFLIDEASTINEKGEPLPR